MLYRVTSRYTYSLQPGGSNGETVWEDDVKYCGYDRRAARRVYHASKPLDFFKGFGGSCLDTVVVQIEDAGTDDFIDDKVCAITLEHDHEDS